MVTMVTPSSQRRLSSHFSSGSMRLEQFARVTGGPPDRNPNPWEIAAGLGVIRGDIDTLLSRSVLIAQPALSKIVHQVINTVGDLFGRSVMRGDPRRQVPVNARPLREAMYTVGILANGFGAESAVRNLNGLGYEFPTIRMTTFAVDPSIFDKKQSIRQVAIETFKHRIPLSKEEWASMDALLQQRVFTMAGVTTANLKRQVQPLIDEALTTNMLFEDWRQRFLSSVSGYISPGGSHLKTVFNTTLAREYSMARGWMFQHPDVAASGFLGGLQFSAINDEVTTPICRHYDTQIFWVGDEAINSLTPPLWYNCRSIWVPVPAADMPRDAKYSSLDLRPDAGWGSLPKQETIFGGGGPGKTPSSPPTPKAVPKASRVQPTPTVDPRRVITPDNITPDDIPSIPDVDTFMEPRMARVTPGVLKLKDLNPDTIKAGGYPAKNFSDKKDVQTFLNTAFPGKEIDLGDRMSVAMMNEFAREIDQLAAHYPAPFKDLSYISFTRPLDLNVGGEYIPLHRGITVKSFASHKEYSELWGFSDLPDWSGYGFHPFGTSQTPAHILTHEFGHHVDFWLRKQVDKAYLPFKSDVTGRGIVAYDWELFRQSISRSPSLSKYAVSKDAEMTAEAFSAMKWGRGAKTAYQQRLEAFLSLIGDMNNWEDAAGAIPWNDIPQEIRHTLFVKSERLRDFLTDEGTEWEDRWRDGVRRWKKDKAARDLRGTSLSYEDDLIKGHEAELEARRQLRKGSS